MDDNLSSFSSPPISVLLWCRCHYFFKSSMNSFANNNNNSHKERLNNVSLNHNPLASGYYINIQSLKSKMSILNSRKSRVFFKWNFNSRRLVYFQFFFLYIYCCVCCVWLQRNPLEDALWTSSDADDNNNEKKQQTPSKWLSEEVLFCVTDVEDDLFSANTHF